MKRPVMVATVALACQATACSSSGMDCPATADRGGAAPEASVDAFADAQTSDVAAMTDGSIAHPIYAVDSMAHRIVRMDDMSGAGFASFGSMGSGTNQFGGPTGLALDAAGRIYVADTNNGRIVRVDDISGAGWITLGTTGAGKSQFMTPFGVSVDAAGHIYVADTGNGRIVRVDDMTGAGWTTFGVAGKAQGQLWYPAQVGFDGGGHLLIADGSNGRIVRIDDMTGAGWTALTPKCGFVGGVVTDASGKIYFACDGGQISRVDDMAGANPVTVPLPGGPVTIDGISVDGAGSVYVGTARGIARVQGISAGGSTVTMYRGSLVDAVAVAVR